MIGTGRRRCGGGGDGEQHGQEPPEGRGRFQRMAPGAHGSPGFRTTTVRFCGVKYLAATRLTSATVTWLSRAKVSSMVDSLPVRARNSEPTRATLSAVERCPAKA